MKHVLFWFSFLIYKGSIVHGFDEFECGRPLDFNRTNVESVNVNRGDFPWIVAIYYKNSDDLNSTYEYICDGTLVSDTKIVTAAQCMRPKEKSEPIKPSELSLFFGSQDLNNHYEAGRSISPVWKVLFPENSDKMNDDIAMLVVEEKIQFSKFIRPICLLSEKETVEEGTVVGWTKSSKSESINRNVPSKLKLTIYSKADCLEQNPQFETINTTFSFCAGAPNIEVCTGDSGHGLAVVKDDIYYLKGVLSSLGCENKAVYTDVFPYNHFIRDYVNPCNPTPCGPYSICRLVEDAASCSCLPSYKGNPPDCRGECVVNSDCPVEKGCINQSCQDPCSLNVCGIDATCEVKKQGPFCSCSEGYTGDPFIKCYKTPVPLSSNVCDPNPCGKNAKCEVKNDSPVCACDVGFNGDPFYLCLPYALPIYSACDLSPCGENSVCKNENETAVCSCADGFYGDAYKGCRSDCLLNIECPEDFACLEKKCKDPCPGVCGEGAECKVIKHNPVCACPSGFTGNPLLRCNKLSD